MPSGDEGTGLHAFDDLDPISTVSALNAMPDDVEERPRTPAGAPRSAPPPPPGRRFGTLPMGGDGHGTSSGVRSTPPPPFAPGSLPPAPRSGVGARSSTPPPPPRLRDTIAPSVSTHALHDDDAQRESDGDEDTRVVPNAFANDPEYGAVTSSARSTDDESEQFEDFGSSAHGARDAVGPGSDDGDLAELSATTVATNIDMDWDEEDVKTKLRDDDADDASISGAHAPAAAPFVSGRPSPFPSAMPSPYVGNPSPFSAAPAPGYAQQSQPLNWESDEEAMTRVMTSPTFPPPALPRGMSWGADSLAPASNTATVSGTHAGMSDPRMKLAWVGLAAAALIGAAFGARTLLTNDEPGTVTIVTKPTDAEVIVNGRPIESGKSSPFTVQDLAPDQEHSIVVRKTGYAEQTHHFELEGGEVKALPNVELTPLRVDTGFTLSSVPEGASIYVDDVKLAATTPARIADLKPGLHVIRLELGDGYQPWETQVALASGQVIELPTARLVGGGGGTRAAAKVAAAPSSHRSSGSSSSRSSRRSSNRSSRTPRAVAPVQTASAPVRFAPVPASQPKVSGAQGTLRLNSRPWAQVFVDGRMVGNTPVMNMPLSAGSHSIKLVNPQLGMTKNLKVKIQNGQVTTKIVELME